MDRHPHEPGHAPAAALAHPGREDGFQGRWRRQVTGQFGRERGLALGVQAGRFLEEFAVLEAALRVAEHVLFVALGRESGLDEPSPGFHRQIGPGRAKEVAAGDAKGHGLAGFGLGRVGAKRHADAVGHELLDLEAVLADDRLAGDDFQAVGPGQGLAGQGLLEADRALGSGNGGLFADLAALGIGQADEHRHGGRHAQTHVAHHGQPFQGLARAVDVALAVDEGGIAGGRHDRAADVEAGVVGPEAVVEQEAHVRAFLGHDEIGALVGVGPGSHLGPEKSLGVGCAGGDLLVLVGVNLDRGPGQGGQGGGRGGPDQQVAGTGLGHDADVGEAHEALVALELARDGQRDAVESGFMALDVFFQVDRGDLGGVALVAQRHPVAEDAVAQVGVDPAAAVVVLEGGVVHGEKREHVVEIDPVDGHLGGGGVDAFHSQVLVAVSRQKHALVAEIDGRGQIRDAHGLGRVFTQDRAVAGGQPFFQGDGVFPAGFEFAAQNEFCAVGGQFGGQIRFNADVAGCGLARFHRGGHEQAHGGHAFFGYGLGLAQAQIGVQGHRDNGHGFAAKAYAALFRSQSRGDDDFHVALLGGFFDGIGDEFELLGGVGGGQRHGHGFVRGAGIDELDVVDQGLGVHGAVKGRFAANHDHGPAFRGGLEMGGEPGHLEAAVAGLPGILAGQGLGRGKKILALEGDGVDGGLGKAVLGLEAQHVGRYPGPAAGDGRLDGGRIGGRRGPFVGSGHGPVKGGQEIAAAFGVHGQAGHAHGVEILGLGWLGRGLGGCRGLGRGRLRRGSRRAGQQDEFAGRDAKKDGDEPVFPGLPRAAVLGVVHAGLQ